MFIYFLLIGVASAQSSCPIDWTDDDAVTNTLAISVACDPSTITVSIDGCILVEAGFNLTNDVTINGDSVTTTCLDFVPKVAGNIWEATLDPITECSTTTTNTASSVTYSNTLTVFDWSNTGSSVVYRNRHPITIPFSCEYSTEVFGYINDDTTYGVTVEPEAVTATENTGAGGFGLTIVLSKDVTLNGAYSAGATIFILKDTYIVIVADDASLIVYFKKITVEAEDGTKYDLLDANGCVTADEKTAGTTENYAAGKTTLLFKAFQIADNEDLSFELTLVVCDPSAGACKSPCDNSGRRRRSMRMLDGERVITSVLGPFKTA